MSRRLQVLVLSWNFPTPAAPQRGLWVERMCTAVSPHADVRVIVPTPWTPPLVPIDAFSSYRRVPRREARGPVQVAFPRVPGSIDYHTHDFDARLARSRVLRTAAELHAERPFDVVHAHFVYPDGVVGSTIARRLGIPLMTSEHAFWTPWLDDRHRVGTQVADALPDIDLVCPVSTFLKEDVDSWARGRVETAVLPNVLDDEVFRPDEGPRDPDQLLYVGLIRGFKRVDILLKAFAIARDREPGLRLRILSAASRAYRKDRQEMHELIDTLGVSDAIQIETGADPPAVAEAMRRCTLVVVSSRRRETFCSVAAEALGCGTPLAITRCGGPEEFFEPGDGVMVDADDPEALASAILEVRARRDGFRGAELSERIGRKFGRAAWGELAMAKYEGLVARRSEAAHR